MALLRREDEKQAYAEENLTMTEQMVMQLGRDTLATVVMLASPLLLVGLTVGLLVTVLQTVTSIREQTLTFVPKMAAVLGALVILMPWLLRTLCKFTAGLLMNLDRLAG